MSKTRTRFDIAYDGTPGRQRLTIKCNFPEFEKGAVHRSKVFFGSRAVKHFDLVQKMVRQGPDSIERWIMNVCLVGARSISTDMINHMLMESQRPSPSLSSAENAIRGLGAMPLSEIIN